MEGRLLFENAKKILAFILSHCLPIALPALMYAFFGIPQPMGAVLSLFMDLFVDSIQATGI